MTGPTLEALTGLAARLTRPEDRETYARLLSYFHSLPDHDELFQIVELLGLLSLLGQRLPDALGEFLTELREQTKASLTYHNALDVRLAGLPQEIAAGVSSAAFSRDIGEAFRQQITAAGLENAAVLLRNTSREITTLSGQISATLRPLSEEYKAISSTISLELTKLTDAAERLEAHNTHLFQRDHTTSRRLRSALALVLLLCGGLCGIEIGKRQTAADLIEIQSLIEHSQNPQAPTITSKDAPKQSRRKAEAQ